MMAMTQIGAMTMPSSFPYQDVLLKGFPQHNGWDWFRRKHPPMPVSRWAKIFAPFDALRGFDDAIDSKEVPYTDRPELDDSQKRELSRRLSILHQYTFNSRMARENHIIVTIEFFVPCTDPDHFAYILHKGQYKSQTGVVLSVDETDETIAMQAENSKIVMDFEDILSIEPLKEGLFDELSGLNMI